MGGEVPNPASLGVAPLNKARFEAAVNDHYAYWTVKHFARDSNEPSKPNVRWQTFVVADRLLRLAMQGWDVYPPSGTGALMATEPDHGQGGLAECWEFTPEG